jgi:hypothetical protein
MKSNLQQHFISQKLSASMLVALLISLGVALLPVSTVQADIGPQESMRFTFQYQIEPTSIISGQLLECTDVTCKTNESFRYGYFNCQANSCSSVPYGGSYSHYQKLVLTFADKTRESNVFTKVGFGAEYTVTVKDDGLYVREVFASLSFFNPFAVMLFVPALALSLLAELTAAALYFRVAKLSISLWLVVCANLLSLPVVWFLFPILLLDTDVTIVLYELFAIVFEAAFLYFVGRNKGISLRHAGALSLIMNLASIALGVLVVSALAFLL